MMVVCRPAGIVTNGWWMLLSALEVVQRYATCSFSARALDAGHWKYFIASSSSSSYSSSSPVPVFNFGICTYQARRRRPEEYAPRTFLQTKCPLTFKVSYMQRAHSHDSIYVDLPPVIGGGGGRGRPRRRHSGQRLSSTDLGLILLVVSLPNPI